MARTGSGVFITADAQQQAQGDMLAMQVALSQLQQAQQLTQSLRGAAEVAKAELADLQSQKALLSEAITQLKQSVLLLSAPSGIAQTTAKSLQLSAGQNIITTSGENTDFSVLKAFRVAAGELISLFAEKMGIKIFAAKGRVEIQAQSDELALNALKDIRVSSSEGKIIIRAEQDILLIGSGGAYIRIGNGEVESGAPDKIIQRAAVWQKFSGQSASVMAQKWDKADFSYTPKAIHLYDGEALPAQNMVVKSEDDGIKILSTAQNGKATLQKQSGVAADRMQFKDNK